MRVCVCISNVLLNIECCAKITLEHMCLTHNDCFSNGSHSIASLSQSAQIHSHISTALFNLNCPLYSIGCCFSMDMIKTIQEEQQQEKNTSQRRKEGEENNRRRKNLQSRLSCSNLDKGY